jgi:hypothetical protein
MNVNLCLSTHLMVKESPVKAEAGAFIDWLQSEGHSDYVIDCHMRRPAICDAASPPRQAPTGTERGRDRSGVRSRVPTRQQIHAFFGHVPAVHAVSADAGRPEGRARRAA